MLKNCLKKSIFFMASTFLVVNAEATVFDSLPYKGPKNTEHCKYKPAFLDAKKSERIGVEFDIDCKTAFILPPRITYELTTDISFRNSAVRYCGELNQGTVESIKIAEEIRALETKLRRSGLNSFEMESLQISKVQKRRVDRLIQHLERKLSSITGANFNLYVSFKEWDMAISAFEKANPKMSVKKLPISLGHLNMVSTKVASNEDDFSGDIFRTTSFDTSVLKELQLTMPRLTDEYAKDLAARYSMVPEITSEDRMFGTSGNVLVALTAYGACMIDRDGDGNVSEKDITEEREQSKLGNYISFGYTFYTPYRTGIIVKAKITNKEEIIKAIKNYREKAPVHLQVDEFYKVISDAADRAITTTVVDTVAGVSRNTQLEIQAIENVKVEVADMLAVQLSKEAASLGSSTKKDVRVAYSERYCRHYFLGGCVSHGRRTRYRWDKHTDYDEIINKVDAYLKASTGQEQILFQHDSQIDTIGSKFFYEARGK